MTYQFPDIAELLALGDGYLLLPVIRVYLKY